MSRWTQTWLSGSLSDGDGGAGQAYRGQRLGLPERGPGSVAGFGARGAAIALDWLPCYLAAQLLTTNPAVSTLAIFAALTVLSVAAAGRSPGHAVVGLRVAMLDGQRAGFAPAVIRTVLICLVIPPLVYNTDGRGLHDRAAATIVLRTR
ncbi:MAG: RDD family protein [Pseudonocardiaceae bacterium]|nr:RDD family protein [Pseudonocardiaceae bacterium]